MDPELFYDIRRASCGLIEWPEGPSGKLPPLTQERRVRDARAVLADCDFVDPAVSYRTAPAQGFRQVFEMNGFLKKVILASIRQAHPGTADGEVERPFLRRMGTDIRG